MTNRFIKSVQVRTLGDDAMYNGEYHSYHGAGKNKMVTIAVEKEESVQRTSDKSPIEILREKCQRDKDGFLILTPDIDVDAIVKSTGARGFTSPKKEFQNETLNKEIQGQ